MPIDKGVLRIHSCKYNRNVPNRQEKKAFLSIM